MSIDQTTKIDYIHFDRKRENVFLTVSDHLDWETNSIEHLWVLQEKINSYFRFIESGEMFEKFPMARDKAVIIRVIGKYPLNEEAKKFYADVKSVARNAGYTLKFEHFQSNQHEPELP